MNMCSHSICAFVIAIAHCLLAPGCIHAAEQTNTSTPSGFTATFNGRDFHGWTGGEVKPPSDFEKMSYQEWYDYRNRMHRGVNKHWKIDDGQMIGVGDGPDMVSWKHYGDFEMHIEWKLSPEAKAGIGLRFGPHIQLVDPWSKQAEPDEASNGSGGLGSNQSDAKQPIKKADKPIGEWNRMYVRMVGPYTTVVLNGQTVVDNAVMENMFSRKEPIDPKGPIHLQSIAGEVCFRNIAIRELADTESNKLLTDILGDKESFKPLFNGKDLTGWAGAIDGFEVVDGCLQSTRKKASRIKTAEQYGNYVLRFEFKLPPAANSGILVHAPNADGGRAKNVLEVQILDDEHPMHRKLGDSQYHGSLYGIAAARRGYLRPTGQWNHQELIVNGNHFTVRLNGYPILNAHLKQLAPNHPAINRKRGHIGIAGYVDPVMFRNMQIRELD